MIECKSQKDTKPIKIIAINGIKFSAPPAEEKCALQYCDGAETVLILFKDNVSHYQFRESISVSSPSLQEQVSAKPDSPAVSLTLASSSTEKLPRGSKTRPSSKPKEDSKDEDELPSRGSASSSSKRKSFVRRSIRAALTKDDERNASPKSNRDRTNTEVMPVEPIDWEATIHVIQEDNVQQFQLIFEEHADIVNAVEESRLGWTALHHACKSKAIKIIKFLIEKGASVATKNENATTPFQYLADAACTGLPDFMPLIEIALAAHPGVLALGNDTGDKPIHRVTSSCVEKPHGREFLAFLISKGADVNASNSLGNTPLLIAVWNKDIETVKLLLEHGADFNQKDSKGNNALKAAKEVGSKDLQSLLENLFEERRVRQITNIIKEIISTETDYVRDLQVGQDVYRTSMIKECHISERASDALFWNMAELHSINSAFLSDLLKIDLTNINKANVGAIFLKHMDKLKSGYLNWCSNQAITSRTMKVMLSHPFIEQWFETKRSISTEVGKQGISSFIIKPLQRACRYPLLLRELIKFTPESIQDYGNLERATTAIQALVGEANELKRVADIEQEALDNLTEQGITLAPDSSLIHQGNIAVLGTKVDSYFLFSDTFVLAAPGRAPNKPKPHMAIQFLKRPQIWNLENYEGGDKNLVDAFIVVVPGRNRVPTTKTTLYCSSLTDKHTLMNLLRAQIALTEQKDIEALRKQALRATSGVEEPEPLRAVAFHELFAKGYIDPSSARGPLHEAVDSGDLARVKALIKKPTTPINSLDESGRTPLILCVTRLKQPNQMDIAEALLSRHDCNVNLATKDGMVAIMYIAQAATAVNFLELEVKLLETMIERRVKVNMSNYTEQHTPLHYAVMAGSEQLTAWLLRLGANANFSNSIGDAPLHLAVKKRNVPLIKMLLRHAADPLLVRGSTGQTALDIANSQQESHPEVVHAFTEMKAEVEKNKLFLQSGGKQQREIPILLDSLVTAHQLPRFHNPVPAGLPANVLANRLEDELQNYSRLMSVAQLLQSILTAVAPASTPKIEQILSDFNSKSQNAAAATAAAAAGPSPASSSNSSSPAAASSSSSYQPKDPKSSPTELIPSQAAASKVGLFEQMGKAETSASSATVKRPYIPKTAAQSTGSIPQVDKVVPYETIKTQRSGLDISCLEAYLSDEEFTAVFNLSKQDFYRLPAWKQTNMKRNVDLF
ncbi:MAG: ankyrin repeat domain-containing protein [archaeon]|nr:ankyrin repeat domain-containing protein [archaeon]